MAPLPSQSVEELLLDPLGFEVTNSLPDNITALSFIDQPFQGIFNFRDVGETINRICGKRLLKEKMIYRSGRLDDATSEDRRLFVQEYGIKTIIDLRTKTERIRRAEARETTPATCTDPPLGSGSRIPGVTTYEVNFIGRSLEIAFLRMLSVWSIIKVLVFMLFGLRLRAVTIIGREVLNRLGLRGIGEMSLKHCRSEIKEALDIYGCFFNSNNPGHTLNEEQVSQTYPILIHCTQGKDRTGLIVILLLLLLSIPSPPLDVTATDPVGPSGSITAPITIPVRAIATDYSLSSPCLLPMRAAMTTEIIEAGLDESFLEADEGFLEYLLGVLEKDWGGIEGYLFGDEGIGLDRAVVERCRKVLVLNTGQG